MRWAALVVAILWPLAAGVALAEKRVALVIGNSNYEHAITLINPVNDATDMAAKLSSLGFEVFRGEDLDLAGVKRLIRQFSNAVKGADLALFYYAGHGIQVNGSNYLIPVDANIDDETTLDFETIEMNSVLKAMAVAPTNVVFLDACRNNPFKERLERSLQRSGRTRNVTLGKGLAQLNAGTGTLIAYATQPDEIAFDGEGRNSPFTAGLLKHLGQPGMSLTDELILVRNEVLQSTNRLQQPWDHSSLTGRVVLNPQAPAPIASLLGSDYEIARSLGTREAFEAFIERHGNSGDLRVGMAKRRLAALSPAIPREQKPTVTSNEEIRRKNGPYAAYSDAVVCGLALVRDADGSLRWKQGQFSTEAVYRRLSLLDCAALSPSRIEVAQVPSLSIEVAQVPRIDAIPVPTPRPSREQENRPLDVSGLKPIKEAPQEEAPSSTAAYSDAVVCRNATLRHADGSTRWIFGLFRGEALRRRLSLDDCRVILREERLGFRKEN